MSQTNSYQIEWEGQEKQPGQKDRQVYETSNQKALEWIQTQLHQKQWEEHEKKEESRQKPKSGAPIVVINHLNYPEHDIQTIVDQVLTKNEFSDDSSIFVVVPSLDSDAGNFDEQTSTICIQMSPNLAKWKTNVNPVNHDPQQRQHAAAAHQGMKILYGKGKKFSVKGLPIQILSFHNKHNLFEHGHPMPKEKKNKMCQISTHNEIVEKIEHRCNVVSTDTTTDRPCCCNPNTTQYSDCSPNDKCAMSKLVTPLLEQGMIGNPFHNRWVMKQQESVMLVNVPLLPRVILPSRLHHAQAYTQYSANPAQYPANPAQKIQNRSKMQTCQCSPDMMLELLKLAVKGSNIQNMQSIGCGKRLPPAAHSKKPEHPEVCKMEPTLTEPAACPCGRTPERMQIEMREAKQKQACIKETRLNSSVGTSTEHESYQFKIGKKTIKNIVSECPQCEPEPKLLPESEPILEPYIIPYAKDVFADNLKKKSLETLRVSGFKINQKKGPPPEAQLEYTVEDALRYYAMMNPELFQSIMAEQQTEKDGTERKPPSSAADNFGLEATSDSEEEEEYPFKGLKFKIGGKGSGSQGLAGICCFDLLQESFTTW